MAAYPRAIGDYLPEENDTEVHTPFTADFGVSAHSVRPHYRISGDCAASLGDWPDFDDDRESGFTYFPA